LRWKMAIKPNHDRSVWCDICKGRWGVKHVLGQTPARWIVISETQARKGMKKHYCQPCANEAQMDGDGNPWTFREQLDYALKREQIDGMGS
jgi:hypothetical protein